jgi:cell division protein FtsB
LGSQGQLPLRLPEDRGPKEQVTARETVLIWRDKTRPVFPVATQSSSPVSEDDYQIERYRSDGPSAWQRWNRRLLIIIFLCLGIISWRLFVPELKRNHEIDTELAGLRGVLERESATNRQLTREVSWLTDPSDPTYLETIARDKLHAAKPGETVIRLETEDPRNVLREGNLPITAPPEGY